MHGKREREDLFFSRAPWIIFPLKAGRGGGRQTCVLFRQNIYVDRVVLPWVSRCIFHQDGCCSGSRDFGRAMIFFFFFLSFNLKFKVLPRRPPAAGRGGGRGSPAALPLDTLTCCPAHLALSDAQVISSRWFWNIESYCYIQNETITRHIFHHFTLKIAAIIHSRFFFFSSNGI